MLQCGSSGRMLGSQLICRDAFEDSIVEAKAKGLRGQGKQSQGQGQGQ